jgi:hypothetical protein
MLITSWGGSKRLEDKERNDILQKAILHHIGELTLNYPNANAVFSTVRGNKVILNLSVPCKALSSRLRTKYT